MFGFLWENSGDKLLVAIDNINVGLLWENSAINPEVCLVVIIARNVWVSCGENVKPK